MQLTENLSLNTSSPDNNPPNNRMEWGKVFILFGLALYFAWIIINGDLNNYINVRFAWLSYVAVILFVMLGGANLYGILQQQKGQYNRLEHTTLSWGVLGIVAVPLVLGTLIPSEPLGAEAINGTISTNAYTLNRATQVTRDPLERNVLEWLRVFNDGTPSSFNGEPADVTGFVYREPGFGDDIFMVARFTLSCCVADASAIGVPATFSDDTELAIGDGEWVRVTGAFEAGDFRGAQTPILMVESIEVIEQPEHPYLYP